MHICHPLIDRVHHRWRPGATAAHAATRNRLADRVLTHVAVQPVRSIPNILEDVEDQRVKRVADVYQPAVGLFPNRVSAVTCRTIRARPSANAARSDEFNRTLRRVVGPFQDTQRLRPDHMLPGRQLARTVRPRVNRCRLMTLMRPNITTIYDADRRRSPRRLSILRPPESIIDCKSAWGPRVDTQAKSL